MKREIFWQVAETWYQRTHRLREYSEDRERPDHKREQAQRLFSEMFIRMQFITQAAIRINTPKNNNSFPSGGITDDKSNNSKAGFEWVAQKRESFPNGMKFTAGWVDEAAKIRFK